MALLVSSPIMVRAKREGQAPWGEGRSHSQDGKAKEVIGEAWQKGSAKPHTQSCSATLDTITMSVCPTRCFCSHLQLLPRPMDRSSSTKAQQPAERTATGSPRRAFLEHGTQTHCGISILGGLTSPGQLARGGPARAEGSDVPLPCL